jgi:hypothetical protein
MTIRVGVVEPDRRPFATPLRDKTRFNIGQADHSPPVIPADICEMGALVVRAKDQEAANAHLAHSPQSDLLIASHHGPSLARAMLDDLGFLTLIQCGDRRAP